MKLIQDYISEKIKLYKKKIMLSIYIHIQKEKIIMWCGSKLVRSETTNPHHNGNDLLPFISFTS